MLFVYFGSTDATEVHLPRYSDTDLTKLITLWTMEFLSHSISLYSPRLATECIPKILLIKTINMCICIRHYSP
ncbi:hypothetical protein HAPAU_30420 [Halalkalicoccus paucihalophilus]|uniref:Uncharacterized protein n=1 Tax=Halalkalicoccus paucihalophilus TaxID=1008153 RepID=A0A151ABL5_9EURY|nr:hypothetical protein HAPAU_30420 [Halalkalicoccus paucihalophilus]